MDHIAVLDGKSADHEVVEVARLLRRVHDERLVLQFVVLDLPAQACQPVAGRDGEHH